MKKLLGITLGVAVCLIGIYIGVPTLTTFAATAIPWTQPAATSNFITPTNINGKSIGITVNGTSTLATTTTGVLNGVIVVDGVHYPTTAAGINAAICAAIPTSGSSGEVDIPPGIDILNASINYRCDNIRTGVHLKLKGAGIDTTTLKLGNNVATNPAIRSVIQGYPQQQTQPLNLYPGASSTVEISDMTVDYNGQNQTLNRVVFAILGDNTFASTYVHNLKIKNAVVPTFSRGTPSYGIAFDPYDARNVRAENLQLTNNDEGLWVTSYSNGIDVSSFFTYNTISSSTDAAIYDESGSGVVIGFNYISSSPIGIDGNNLQDTDQQSIIYNEFSTSTVTTPYNISTLANVAVISRPVNGKGFTIPSRNALFFNSGDLNWRIGKVDAFTNNFTEATNTTGIELTTGDASTDGFSVGTEQGSSIAEFMGSTGNVFFRNNIGIGTTSPFARLSIQSNNGDTATTLFAIGSSTQSATTTLFSISNTGSTTIGRLGTCSGSNALQTNSSGTISCGAVTNSGGTVTSVNATYPVQSSGGNTPTISLAFGTTTTNIWSNLQTFTTGFLSSASSTIGNGTQAAGLTISGGATTTGNAVINGTLAVGKTTINSPSSISTNADIDVALGSYVRFNSDGNWRIGGVTASAPTTRSMVSGNSLYMTGDSIVFGANTGNSSLELNNSTGAAYIRTKLGIANTAPAYPLDVTGSGHFSTFVDASYFVATSSTASTFVGGFISQATSTIGNGTAAGGLTISGGATTTGNAIFSGKIDIGSTNPPGAFLQIDGSGTNSGQLRIGIGSNAWEIDRDNLSTGRLRFTTTSGTEAFSLNGNGGVMIGNAFTASTPPAQGLAVQGIVGIGSSTPFAKLSIQANNLDTNTVLFAIGSSTATATTTLYSVDNKGHQYTSGSTPSVTGGTSSVAGNDNNGTITVTGTLLTSITLTFATSWNSAPDCTIADSSTGITAGVTSISTTQLVIAFSAGVNSGTAWYRCVGHI